MLAGTCPSSESFWRKSSLQLLFATRTTGKPWYHLLSSPASCWRRNPDPDVLPCWQWPPEFYSLPRLPRAGTLVVLGMHSRTLPSSGLPAALLTCCTTGRTGPWLSRICAAWLFLIGSTLMGDFFHLRECFHRSSLQATFVHHEARWRAD